MKPIKRIKAAKTTKPIKPYRGTKCGVFEGANGYYVGWMAEDGVSHYQPASGGDGWSDATLRECNRDARSAEMENDDC